MATHNTRELTKNK